MDVKPMVTLTGEPEGDVAHVIAQVTKNATDLGGIHWASAGFALKQGLIAMRDNPKSSECDRTFAVTNLELGDGPKRRLLLKSVNWLVNSRFAATETDGKKVTLQRQAALMNYIAGITDKTDAKPA